MFENFEKLRIKFPQIVLGTFKVKNYQVMYEMVKTALENSCYAFDTSPSYGTEIDLGKALAETKALYESREKIFITTKIDPMQMYESNGNIESYVNESLNNLKLDYIDLLLIHWPFEKYINRTWKTMINLQEKGIIKNIGICNVNVRVMKKFIEENLFDGKIPQFVQNEISPLRTCEEDIKYFKENNIIIQAYSPLCRMKQPIKESEILKELAKKYNKDIGQIILRWHIDKGIIPVFTSTKSARIKSNLDIFNFKISDEDITKINELNQNYKIFLESFGCPGI